MYQSDMRPIPVNCVKRGKTRTSKSRLVLARLVNQSQSVVSQKQNNRELL